MQFHNLKAQWLEYQNEIQKSINDVCEHSCFINGPEINELEQQLKLFVGANSITCASGTDALKLALMAIGIQEGDEVITSPFSFIAAAEMIVAVGAKPVFVDILEDNFIIDHSKIESAITPKTKAIIPISLFGKTAEMDDINKIASKHDLFVIEDAAQSFGACYRGKKSGNLSSLAITSFFPTKPLGCYGDGGAIFTQSIELENKIRSLKNHGQTERYIHKNIGMNSRLDSIQAAVLKVKLNHYPTEIIKRQNIAELYSSQLPSLFKKDLIQSWQTSVWAQYPILCSNRDDLQEFLTLRQIPFSIHYPKPLHLQEVFDGKVGQFPIAEKISNEILCLPMCAFVDELDLNTIIHAIREWANKEDVFK